MIQVSPANVKPLGEGKNLVTKQMRAKAGQLLPKHMATVESALVVVQGECAMMLGQEDHILVQGSSLIIPAEVWHQIRATEDFTAIHIMPKGIKFEFAD